MFDWKHKIHNTFLSVLIWIWRNYCLLTSLLLGSSVKLSVMAKVKQTLVISHLSYESRLLLMVDWKLIWPLIGKGDFGNICWGANLIRCHIYSQKCSVYDTIYPFVEIISKPKSSSKMKTKLIADMVPMSWIYLMIHIRHVTFLKQGKWGKLIHLVIRIWNYIFVRKKNWLYQVERADKHPLLCRSWQSSAPSVEQHETGTCFVLVLV